MTERTIWARRLSEDPAGLLALNAPPGETGQVQPTGQASTLQVPPMAGLYIAPEETDLPVVARALETGDTSGLPPALASEVDEARRVTRFSKVRVPGAGGDALDAVQWIHGDGTPRPAIIMPSPWADMGWLAYAVQGMRFATKGYDVLAYSARGFGQSEGEVEVAGEADIQDGVEALNYFTGALGQEPTKVGFLGDSYGSGISQIVAAQDSRVDAVVAMSTWGDLATAFYENRTRHLASVAALLGAAKNARLSKRTQEIFDLVLAGADIDDILLWAEDRSPLTHIDALNARRVPILFAQAWHETLFPSNQTLEMFNRLEGPKRLLFSVGDHSGPEMSGMIGLPNRIWSAANRWFDHFLREEDNGTGNDSEVVSQIMWSRALETHPDWAAVTQDTRKLYLSSPAEGGGDGQLTEAESAGWERAFQVGTHTLAEVADTVIWTGLAEMLGRPKVYATPDIPRSDALVWSAPATSERLRLHGIPKLHLTVTSSTREATFIAYLLDAGADGNAHIITHAPFTAPAATIGGSGTVDLELQATGYDIRAGRRLMLVIDSKDAFYSDTNEAPHTLTVSSPAGDASYLELPLG
ncbi:ABC transporter ATP-binding protein [Streptomyces chrestomyceticus JCM 4735]|uniref:ABC transporter ATP-binding protein n=1 Tax=Streptomyces chrestomyceticus JCM 4735 TaxID=1306181 RepID=A0A7U9L372_9ACTN|nr:CocE/NonD family hydrolase [Streptomyces chrestomyceticus]GCD39553.1 ABC transporter ATP-binding protein [Streptomyces chrestomyceticus JCM 4735]